MDSDVIPYLFIGSLFVCVGCLFRQCRIIRRDIQNEREQPIYIYQPIAPSAPPFDYIRLAEDEEPREVSQV